MGHYITTNWLLGVNSVSHTTAGISHHLVGHENCDVELLTDLLNL
jgi:hypothetical protein